MLITNVLRLEVRGWFFDPFLIKGLKYPVRNKSYYYNQKYSRSGHVFQDRFKSEPVNDMAYFVTLLRYIHQNPTKAGMVSKVGDFDWRDVRGD